MEINDNSPVGGKNKSPIGEPDNRPNSLLKQQLNIFLISYFNYLALALALIILAAGLFLFIYPQYKSIAKSDDATEKNLQAEYEVKYNYLKAINDLKDSYRLIDAADRKKIQEMVPARGKAIDLIPEIESIVLKNGAVLNAIKIDQSFTSRPLQDTGVSTGDDSAPATGIFGPMPEGVGLARVEVNLSSVNYSVFKNLLKTFENNLWLMDVSKVNYSVAENKANLIIYTYFWLK